MSATSIIKYTLFRFLLVNFKSLVSRRATFSGWYGTFKYRVLLACLIFLLNETQYLPLSEVTKLNSIFLRKIIQKFHRNQAFFGQPTNKKDLCLSRNILEENLESYPFTTKEELKNNTEKLFEFAKRYRRKIFYCSTAGTTGIPLRIPVFQPNYFLNRSAMRTRTFLRAYNGPSREVIFHKSILSLNHIVPYMGFNTHIVRFEREEMESGVVALVPEIQRLKIKVLCASPTLLSWFSKVLKERALHDVGLRLILTTGEFLSEKMRLRFEKILHVPIYQVYGLTEVGTIGGECLIERGTYHLNNEYFIMEIIDKEGNRVEDGSTGEIVVTLLNSDSMIPLIRYRTGDIGNIVTTQCACGITSPRIIIKGRLMEMIHLPSGKSFSSSMISRLFLTENMLEKIFQFRMIQELSFDLRIFFVLNKGKTLLQKEKFDLVKNIQRLCGEEIGVELKGVNDVRITKAGKSPIFVSHVS